MSRTLDRAARSFAAGVGDIATGAALRPAAQFRIGSITKTFVATVVLQLVGEGRLRLDEPVAQRLPGLLSNGHRITVRQLLNHTSGLPDYTEDPELFAGIVKNRVWAPRELVALAEKHPQLFAPGSAWKYSNTNYIVAGLLVEAVTGHSLARELERRIFSPLQPGPHLVPGRDAASGSGTTHMDTSRPRQLPDRRRSTPRRHRATTHLTPGPPGPSSPTPRTCLTSTRPSWAGGC